MVPVYLKAVTTHFKVVCAHLQSVYRRFQSGHRLFQSGHHPLQSGHHPLKSGYHPLESGRCPLESPPVFKIVIAHCSGRRPLESGLRLPLEWSPLAAVVTVDSKVGTVNFNPPAREFSMNCRLPKFNSFLRMGGSVNAVIPKVLGVVDCESEVRISKFRIADTIW